MGKIITLIGFMGCGKSFCARKLSQKFLCPYIDLDDYIESYSGLSVSEIFSTKGETAFRKLETECFEQILQKFAIDKDGVHNDERNKTIFVAVGGGFPLLENNRILLKKTLTFFLDISFDEIYRRITGPEKEKRPLIAKKGIEEIKKLYESRYQVYLDSSDYVIHNFDELLEVISEKVIKI